MPRGKPREYTFDGRRHIINRDDLIGYCQQPGDGEPYEMWINPKAKGRKELDAYVHEATHGEFPKAPEAKVESFGDNLSQLLWDRGYRKRGK